MKINNNTQKVDQNTFSLSFAPSNSTEFPIAYGDDVWDISRNDSSLYDVMGSEGSFTQHDINENISKGLLKSQTDLTSIENDITRIDSSIDGIDSSIDEIETSISSIIEHDQIIDSSISGINSQLDITDSSVNAIEERLGTIIDDASTATGRTWSSSKISHDLSEKQSVIDQSHKLSADLVEDGSTNKVVTQTEKNIWNGKMDKPSDFVSGNFAAFDASGGVKDSNKKESDFASSAQGAKADQIFENYLKAGSTEEETLLPDFNAFADTVHTKAQVLSNTQKTQARTNISAQ